MRRHIAVGRVDAGLVPIRAKDAGAKIVGHDLSRHAAEKFQRPNVRANPVRQGLGPTRLSVGVVGRSQHRDKHLHGAQFTGAAVHDLNRVSGVIDEQPFTSRVHLAHGGRQPAFPATVKFAPAAVAVSRRMKGPVFLPKQLQRHTGTSQFAMDHRPVGLIFEPRAWPGTTNRSEEQRLQPLVGQRWRQRPGQPGRGNPVQARFLRGPGTPCLPSG
jgi:hypothetical protein